MTKPEQVNPSTENISLEKNDIRLYLTKKIGEVEAKPAAFPTTTQMDLSPFPPPTTRPPTTPQLLDPSKDGASAGCMNTTPRGIIETERQTKSDDAAKGYTGC